MPARGVSGIIMADSSGAPVSTLTIATDRLELVAGTAEMARAEIDDPAVVFRLLGAERPADWPPPLNDEQSMAFFLSRLEKGPEQVGWLSWYVALGQRRRGRRVIIGNIGFKGRPDANGTVEIGYSMRPAFQGRGYATEAAHGLIAWAFSHPEVRRVVAETFPDLKPSIRVLEKNGFRRAGPGSEPDAIRFEREK